MPCDDNQEDQCTENCEEPDSAVCDDGSWVALQNNATMAKYATKPTVNATLILQIVVIPQIVVMI
jgi:hypothetical protein